MSKIKIKIEIGYSGTEHQNTRNILILGFYKFGIQIAFLKWLVRPLDCDTRFRGVGKFGVNFVSW